MGIFFLLLGIISIVLMVFGGMETDAPAFSTGLIGFFVSLVALQFCTSDTHTEPPQAKYTNCIQIENTLQQACILEHPNGEKTLVVRENEPEEFVDQELGKREILNEIFGE